MDRAIAPAAEKSKISNRVLLSLVVWFSMIGLATLAITRMRAPNAIPATAPSEEFSAQRALNHVRVIARAPHPIGSEANDRVREYLVSQLSSLGLNPQVQAAVGIHAGGRQIVIGATQNIVGRLAGTANSGAVMLMAHYDSVYRAPGAADDGAGVAAILESLRALRSQPSLKNDLIVLFTDGEEAGLLGADAFASSNPWMKDVGIILNFEARGNHGASLLFETSRNNSALIKAVARSAAHPIGSSFFYSLYRLLPNDTDMTVFRRHNIPALNFAFGENLEAYHSRLDTADELSVASLQHHGSYALSLAQYFGNIDLTKLRNQSGDDVFFDWFGSSFVVYGESWVIPGEILLTLLLLWTILLNIRRSDLKPASLLLALLPLVVILIAVPAVLAAGEWLLARALAGHLIVGDSPANACLLIGLVLLGACAGTLLIAAFRKRFAIQELSIAGLLLVLIMSWILALMLPAGSYLLFWPLLFATLGFLLIALTRKAAGPGAQNLAGIAGTIITVLFFAPIVYLLYIFLTLQLITAIAIGFVLAVFFITCLPFINMGIPSNRGAIVAVILFVCALAMIIVGAKRSVYSAANPRQDTILYSLNTDQRTAAWISYDPSADEWTNQFFSNKPVSRQPMPDYLNGSQRPVLSGPAPLLEMSPPVADIKADINQGGVRKIQLSLKSQRNANALILTFSDTAKPVSVRFGTRDIAVSQNPGPLAVFLLGTRNDGADIELTMKASSELSFWLMDRSFGLPVQPRPRPDNFSAAEGSDVTLISRKYSLPAREH
jgi:Peptidase family M28